MTRLTGYLNVWHSASLLSNIGVHCMSRDSTTPNIPRRELKKAPTSESHCYVPAHNRAKAPSSYHGHSISRSRFVPSAPPGHRPFGDCVTVLLCTSHTSSSGVIAVVSHAGVSMHWECVWRHHTPSAKVLTLLCSSPLSVEVVLLRIVSTPFFDCCTGLVGRWMLLLRAPHQVRWACSC